MCETAGSGADEAIMNASSRAGTEDLIVQPRGVNAIVKMAVLEAHRRMKDPRCQEIFSDFKDASGSPLQNGLDSLGRTGQNYLAWILFVNGELQRGCESSDVLAFTSPGSRIISFCGDRFTNRIKKRGLGTLAVVIIHEELHSLGLGENPPTSLEITRRIEWRCGS